MSFYTTDSSSVYKVGWLVLLQAFFRKSLRSSDIIFPSFVLYCLHSKNIIDAKESFEDSREVIKNTVIFHNTYFIFSQGILTKDTFVSIT